MASPSSPLSVAGLALGALMIAASFATFRLGFEPARFWVTGLVWGSILGYRSVLLGAQSGRRPD